MVRPSLWALARQYFEYGFWKAAVIRKHRRPASWRHLAPGLFLILNLLLIVWMPRMLLAIDIPYLAASLLFSLLAAQKAGWTLLPVLPAAFAVYHFAYGAGFLWGFVRMIV